MKKEPCDEAKNGKEKKNIKVDKKKTKKKNV